MNKSFLKFVTILSASIFVGIGANQDAIKPVSASLTIGAVDKIDHSETHSFIKTKTGKYYVLGKVGSNDWGAMLTRVSEYSTPTEITHLMPLVGDETMEKISVGQNGNIFLTSSNRVLTSGNNVYGQIGNNTSDPYYGQEIPANITSRFNLQEDEIIIDVKSSNYFPIINLAQSNFNRVWVWGSNPHASYQNFANGKSGSGITDQNLLLVPTDITENFLDLGEYEFKQFGFTSNAGFAITNGPFFYSWGKNTKGILGVDSVDETLVNATPEKIDLSGILNEGEIVVSLHTWDTFNNGSVALFTSEQRVIAWGSNPLKFIDETASFISTPTLVNFESIEFNENESIANILLFNGIYLTTTDQRIIYQGTPFLESLASVFTTAQRNAYYQNPYFIDATPHMPVLEETDGYKAMYGAPYTIVVLTESGNIITSGQGVYPEVFRFGQNANYVYSQSPNNKFYLYLGLEVSPYGTYEDGAVFTLPTQPAPDGYYHAGWNLNQDGTPYQGGVGYVFTYSYKSNVRIYPIFVQGVDPNASSQPTSSSSQTTTSEGSSQTTSSQSPVSSTPNSSFDEGNNPPPPMSALSLIIVSTVVGGGLAFGSYLFIFKGFSIGGFSFIALKKWFAAILKRNKKDDKQDKK
jgi:hypothetical protein